MHKSTAVAVSSASLVLVIATACASGTPVASEVTTTTAANDTAPTTTTTTAPGAVDPNAPEVVEPGDIPDDQAFVPYTPPDGAFTVQVPEGWARTDTHGGVTFTDKYNSITIAESPATGAPTAESVAASDLKDVSGDPTFRIVTVKPVTRRGGNGIVALYEVGSAANAVTAKKALLAVERYVFVQDATQVTLTLAGAKGADNVDPWKTVSDSLTWR